MVIVKIKTDNAAFENENRDYEIARILRELARKYENGAVNGILLDYNGNKVGTVSDSG